jgi:hypothetical protein
MPLIGGIGPWLGMVSAGIVSGAMSRSRLSRSS